MHEIFVLAEHRQGELRDINFEMLTLAGKFDSKVTTVLLGSGVDDFASKLAPFSDKVLVVDDPMFESFNALDYQAALKALIEQEKPHLVIIPNTGQGADILASLALAMEASFTSDIIGLEIEGDKPVATRAFYGGKINGRIEFKDADLYMVGLREGAIPAGEGTKSGEM